MKFIFLMKGEQYWISLKDNINEALKDYYEYFISNFSTADYKIFCVLVDSGKLSISELIDYINDSFSDYDDEIDRIFVLGDQIYSEGE